MWRLTQRRSIRREPGRFPGGQRTLNGHVGPFHDGVFRMALQFGTPIVPVSIVGSFEFNHKTSWMLRPARIVVHFHDTIETKELDKRDGAGLRERVREIVAAPIEEHYTSLKSRVDYAGARRMRPALVSCQVYTMR